MLGRRSVTNHEAVTKLMQQQRITDDLEALLHVLPPQVEQALRIANQGDSLLEVILDLCLLYTSPSPRD